MRILLAGDWHSDLHEEVVDEAFRKLGHETIRFPWHQYFLTSGTFARLLRPAYRAQNKYLMGPLVRRLNMDLADRCRETQPDVLFVYRGSHIYADTIRRIKRANGGIIVVGYNNDDPLSPSYPAWMWRHFLEAVPAYDLLLAYRSHNLTDFERLGANATKLLRSWYIPERNRPVHLSECERARFACDVVFVGHYEDDGRLQCLEEVVRHGWKLNLFGHCYGWHEAMSRSELLKPFMPLRPVWGEDYNRALCGARIALCFLSKLNRDTYTRRCFEIPASGTLMLAEYTDDMAALFRMGEHADFFRSPTELVAKLRLYLGNERLRAQVAAAGRKHVMEQGHDVVSRMRCVIDWIGESQRERSNGKGAK